MRFAVIPNRKRDKKTRKLYKKWIGSLEGTQERKINHVRLLLHLEEKDKLQELGEKDKDYDVIISELMSRRDQPV